MHTKQSLQADLMAMGLKPTDTVFIHSSMKAIGQVEGGADTVLDALMEYFASGTLALPTHTWATINWKAERLFDVEASSVCVGILPELFRKRPGVLRSIHPTHSVAAYGAGAADLVQDEENSQSPCDRKGCYGKLLDRNAKILLVGCDLSRHTFIHGVEEWCGIEGRVGKLDTFQIRLQDGSLIEMQVGRHLGTPSEQFPLAEQALIASGALTFGKFGDAKVYCTDAVKTCETITEIVTENPRIFDDPKKPEVG